jgi:hypothetical protein
MPTIVIEDYKFRFYSSDINEPPHVHVIRANQVAKVWLRPVMVEYNHGYNQPTLNYIQQHQDSLLEAWYAYFKS